MIRVALAFGDDRHEKQGGEGRFFRIVLWPRGIDLKWRRGR
jgi:hypothetical protein